VAAAGSGTRAIFTDHATGGIRAATIELPLAALIILLLTAHLLATLLTVVLAIIPLLARAHALGAIVFIVPGRGLAAATRGLLTQVLQSGAQLLKLLAQLLDSLLDPIDLSRIHLLALLAAHPALTAFLVAGLPGIAVLLLSPGIALLANALLLAILAILLAEALLSLEDQGLTARNEFSTQALFFLAALDFKLDFFARILLTDVGGELLDRFDLLTVEMRDDVAFLHTHLFSGAAWLNLSHSHAFLVLSDVDAQSGILVPLAGALRLARVLSVLDRVLIAIILLPTVLLIIAAKPLLITLRAGEAIAIASLLISLALLLSTLLLLLRPLALLLSTLLLLLGALALLLGTLLIAVLIVVLPMNFMFPGLIFLCVLFLCVLLLVLLALLLVLLLLGLILLLLLGEGAAGGDTQREASYAACPDTHFR
jgi:hypothetical protein